jgi:hypothetical protein
MFGYVKAYIPELKIKEYELYRAGYCGGTGDPACGARYIKSERRCVGGHTVLFVISIFCGE